MDSELTNKAHINKLTSKCYYLLRRISRIRFNLGRDTVKIVVQALVISRLDYCNSLLLGTAKTELAKMQRILNMAGRVINRVQKFDSITHHLKDLHWLKITERIEFKVIVIIFKCRHNLAPNYLCEMFVWLDKARTRTSQKCKIVMPRVNTSKGLKASFSYAGAKLWNDLPDNIRLCTELEVFKAKLKTHLFRKSYKL